MRLILLALASVAALLVSAEQTRFDNYRILSVEIENDQQRELIENLAESFDSVQVIADLRNGFIEIVVAPHKIADIDDIFAKNDIKSEVKHMNLQEYGMEMIYLLRKREFILLLFSIDSSTMSSRPSNQADFHGLSITTLTLFTDGWTKN